LELDYSVKFHPVGQGLFTSGCVRGKNGQIFNFVYDCGTSSARKLLDTAISSLPFISNIDLVAVSHFDSDHINGLKKLLNKYNATTLLIPYLSLEERLYIAFKNNIGVSDALMEFYLNPTDYLLAKFPRSIGQIVLVPSVSKFYEEFESFSDNSQSDNLSIDIDETYNEGPRVKMLKKGGRIVYNKIFEFIPYNDSSVAYRSTKSFLNAVKKDREVLLKSKGVNNIQAALARIRDQYDKSFGKSAIDRNIISMFLFAGPCQSNILASTTVYGSSDFISSFRVLDSYKNGILYTGDGYLNTKLKLRQLVEFFGEKRISRIGCLQVMHHGASGCWHFGVAKTLSPRVSVFSSNPDHKSLKHPHAEVVKDFLPYHPVQVDKNNFLEVFFFTR
jgi:hypothetical protein